MEALKSFDLEISDDLFSLFSELIYTTSGIKLGDRKKGLLVSRLAKRLKIIGILNLYDYYHRAKADNSELVEMLNCISTNTTKFFRENYHFEYLKKYIVPGLLERKAREKEIRIWSAGCSTGEEPYSIAMAMHEALSSACPSGWDLKILATDISTRVLDIAKAGIYEDEQLPDDMAAEQTAKYFLKGVGDNGGKIKVKDFVKDVVRFRRLNLKDGALPFNRTFDIIFCRNVMIYFDEYMKRHVLSVFHKYLSDEGHLFLGHSEAMIGNARFKPVHITVYRKQ